MSDLLTGFLEAVKGEEVKRLAVGGDEFIYYVEDGEGLAEISLKFLVPIKRLIEDNCLSAPPPVGYALVIKNAFSGRAYSPEELASDNDADLLPFITYE